MIFLFLPENINCDISLELSHDDSVEEPLLAVLQSTKFE